MFFLKILVGFGATIFVGIFFQDFIGMVAASIICTGGIGLLFWLPVWWLVGQILFFLFSLAETSQQRSQDIKPAEAKADPTLVSYIRKQTRGGVGREEVTQRLKHLGWSDEMINLAYQQANTETQAASP